MNVSRFSLIGVDLEGRWLKAVQFAQHSRNEVRLHAAVRLARAVSNARLPEAPTEDECAQLTRALKRMNFVGTDIALAAPAARTLSATLELPPRSSGAPIEQIARLELARTGRVSPDAFEIGMWEVPPPNRGVELTHVVAVGLEHVHANAVMQPLEQCGFQVQLLATRADALAGLLGPAEGGASLIVEIGWNHTLMTVALGERVLYERMLSSPVLSELYQHIIESCECSVETVDALVLQDARPFELPTRDTIQRCNALTLSFNASILQEVQRAVAYSGHRYPTVPIANLHLLGDGAWLNGLSDLLASELEMQTSVAAPGSLWTLRSKHASWVRSSGLVAAGGLALGQSAHRRLRSAA